MLMAVDWIGFSYAALVSAGGVVGYVKAGRRKPFRIDTLT